MAIGKKSLKYTINSLEKARKQLIKDTNKILFYGAQFAFDAVTLIQGFVLLQYTTHCRPKRFLELRKCGFQDFYTVFEFVSKIYPYLIRSWSPWIPVIGL